MLVFPHLGRSTSRFVFFIGWKVSIFRGFMVRIFPHSDWTRRDTEYLSIFSPNAGNYGPKKLQIRTLHGVKIRVWNTTETNGRVPACDRFYINFWDKIVMSWEFLTSPDFITNLYWPKPFTYSKIFRVSYQYEKVLKQDAMTVNWWNQTILGS